MRQRLSVAAGLIVVVSSTYTLFTADQRSLNFKLHVVLLATLTAATLLTNLRKRT